MRILEEHYLRDDVGLGTLHGASSSPLTPSEIRLLMEDRAGGRKGQREGGKDGGKPVLGILDTNVALEQLDFLENAEVGAGGGREGGTEGGTEGRRLDGAEGKKEGKRDGRDVLSPPPSLRSVPEGFTGRHNHTITIIITSCYSCIVPH